MKLSSSSDDDTKYMLADLKRRIKLLEGRGKDIWAVIAAGLSLCAAVCWFFSAAGQKSGVILSHTPEWAQVFNAASANANLLAASASGLAALAAAISFSRR